MRRLAFVILLATSGCVTRIADLALVSNRNLKLPEPIARSLVGRHCKMQWMPDQQANLEEAIDLAQKSAHGANALANVAIYYEFYYYVLVTRVCFRVEGDAVALAEQ